MRNKAIASIITASVIVFVGLVVVSAAFYLNGNNQTTIVQDQVSTATATATEVIIQISTRTTTVSSTPYSGIVDGNVETITLESATLYGGITNDGSEMATASLTLALNNPSYGSSITSIILTGTGLSSPITSWSTTGSTANQV